MVSNMFCRLKKILTLIFKSNSEGLNIWYNDTRQIVFNITTISSRVADELL